MTSGTSFSAAYVSGLAALMLERNPALKPDEVRAILMKTARDLGAPGRDDLFGAGEADAYAAVSAVGAAQRCPSRGSGTAALKKCRTAQVPATRDVNQPAAAWRPTSRPWTPPIGLPPSNFRPKSPAKRVKKTRSCV